MPGNTYTHLSTHSLSSEQTIPIVAMKKALLNKLRPHHPPPSSASNRHSSPQPPQTLLTPPSLHEILTHRTHHGLNLGGIFVLEKWLFPSTFPPHSIGTSELDFLQSHCQNPSHDPNTLRKTREILENHWHSTITPSDLDQWAALGMTTLRLPLGFFTLSQPSFLSNTPFAAYAAVYTNAWTAVKELCERCAERGLGVLLDLHALPGNANGRDHGGSGDGDARFWDDSPLGKKLRSMGRECVVWVMREVAKGQQEGGDSGVQGVVGLQVMNEAPNWSWELGGRGLGNWYEIVMEELEEEGLLGAVPVYVSDGWDLARGVGWARERNKVDRGRKGGGGGGVVVATSKYFCFSEEDKGMSAEGLVRKVEDEAEAIEAAGGNVADKGAAQVVVTEWSCALDPRSIELCKPERGDDGVAAVRKEFGEIQARLWSEKAGGAFYWTAKTEDGEGEWCFTSMVDQGRVNFPEHLRWSAEEMRRRVCFAEDRIEERKERAVKDHVQYWDATAPKTKFEHWRFEAGWMQGWEDVKAFFEMRVRGGVDDDEEKQKGRGRGVDTIGLMELWVLKRMREARQEGEFAWEWEHGFRQGRKASEDLLLNEIDAR